MIQGVIRLEHMWSFHSLYIKILNSQMWQLPQSSWTFRMNLLKGKLGFNATIEFITMTKYTGKHCWATISAFTAVVFIGLPYDIFPLNPNTSFPGGCEYVQPFQAPHCFWLFYLCPFLCAPFLPFNRYPNTLIYMCAQEEQRSLNDGTVLYYKVRKNLNSRRVWCTKT